MSTDDRDLPSREILGTPERTASHLTILTRWVKPGHAVWSRGVPEAVLSVVPSIWAIGSGCLYATNGTKHGRL
jgi:hypothetical protein